jgi:hypothetical protein
METPLTVQIVRYRSECDIEPVPGVGPMTYDEAITRLQQTPPSQLRKWTRHVLGCPRRFTSARKAGWPV